MTVAAEYRNYSHYIDEGWAKEPKQFFVKLRQLIDQAKLSVRVNCLDVGCATRELIGYLKNYYPDFSYTGIDIFEALIAAAKSKLRVILFCMAF